MIEPINTDVGQLNGRDAIYLDKETFNENREELILLGEINGNLCSQLNTGEFIPYEMKFSGITEYSKVELDDWLSLDKPLFHETSSFYCVKENGKRTYVFQTYDDVFEIQCKSYEFKIIKIT